MKNTGALFILQIANYIVPLIVLLHLTRVLSVEIYGVIAFSIGIVQWAIILTDFGFDLSAAHKISIWRDKKKYLSKFVGAIMLIKLGVFFVVMISLVLYALLSDKYFAYSELFLLSILPILGFSFQPTWFFVGIERMRYITFFSVMAKLIFMVGVILLVSNEQDYLWVPVANGVAQIIAALIGVFFIYKSGYSISLPGRRDIIYAMKVTSGVFFSRLSVATYMSSGVVLLGLVSTPVIVAIYSLAEQLYKAMQSMFVPIVQAIYPYMAKERNFSLFYKVAGGSIALAFTGAILGYFIAPQVVPMVLGENWVPSLSVLNVFFIAIVINVMAVMSGYPLAVAVDRLDIANRSVSYGSIVYLILAGVVIILGEVTPWVFAGIMIVAELYVLVYRGVRLWPQVYRVQRKLYLKEAC